MAVRGSKRARKPDRTGRNERRKSRKGKGKRDTSAYYWKRDKHPYELLRDEWRILVQPGQFVHRRKEKWVADKKPLRYDFGREVTQIEWVEGESGRTGSVTITFPKDEEHQAENPRRIQEGWLFLLLWRRKGTANWRELWRMRAMSPDLSVGAREVSFELVDDLAYLRLSKDSFKYGKSKKHPNGMRVEQIVRAICAAYRQPVGKLARMKTRVNTFKVDGSPYDAILEAIKRENEETDRKLVIRSRKGRLEIVPLKPNNHAYVLGPAIIDATWKRSLRPNFASALRIRGTLSKDGKQKKKKVLITVRSASAIKHFGYILQEATPPDRAHSRKKFRKFGRNELRRRARPIKELTIQHPGIPFIGRWDALRVKLREFGPDRMVFVTEATHTVVPGDYSMSITCRFTDPFADTSDEKKLEKKCKKAKERGRKQAHACKELKKSRKKDKKANQRRDNNKNKGQRRKN